MDNDVSSPKGLVQVPRDTTPQLMWQTLLAVLLFSCIATRLITGLQSRPKTVTHGEPRAVRKAPYWFPWVGHGVSLAVGQQKFISRVRDWTNEPAFSIHVVGKTHNMVMSPSLVKAALSHHGLSIDLFAGHIVDKVFGDRGPIRNMDRQHSKTFHDTTSLLMGEPHVVETSSTMLRLLETETPNLVSFAHSVVDQSNWERPSDIAVVDSSNPPACEVDLFSLTRHFAGYLTSTVFMGKAFVEFYPTLLEDLFTFDKHFDLLLMGAPHWLPLPGVSAAYAARHRLLRAMTVFHAAFASFEEGRDPGFDFRDLDDVSEPMKTRMRCWRKAGFAPGASAPGDLIFLWAMNVDSTSIIFWHLLHILADPELLSNIREEIAPHVRASRPSFKETGLPFMEPPRLSVDLDGLLNFCPLLKASYYETLRMDAAPFSYREVTTNLTLMESAEDAAIDGVKEPRTYSFRQGEYLAIPHGAQSKDPRYFPDPDKFDPRRFIRTDSATGKQTADMGTLRPFGDNAMVCKGRAFAERQIMAFTASILSLWDIEPVDQQGWKIPGHQPASGAYLPKNEVRVRMKHRV